jgi:hypothetical protein
MKSAIVSKSLRAFFLFEIYFISIWILKKFLIERYFICDFVHVNCSAQNSISMPFILEIRACGNSKRQAVCLNRLGETMCRLFFFLNVFWERRFVFEDMEGNEINSLNEFLLVV